MSVKQYLFDSIFPVVCFLVIFVIVKTINNAFLIGFLGSIVTTVLYQLGKYVGETRRQRKP